MAQKGKPGSGRGIHIGTDINIGASRRRTLLEDRLKAGEVTLSNGETLTLGIVADGIGGENAGERAAELTITGIFEYMEQAPVEDIPEMLKKAIEQVNKVVHAEARSDRTKRDMGSTAAVAAIHQNRLYVATAGDSRIYLVRGRQITQLTVDHTWAYEVVRAGKLKPHEADRNPHRDEIVRSVGYQAEVQVDIGLHLHNGEESDEDALSCQGYPLQPGDRVLICSDGLTKNRPDGLGNFVEPAEIVKMVYGIPAQEAARSLVQAALARQVDDNVSVVILEVPGGRRVLRVKKPVAYGFVGAALTALVGIIIALAIIKPDGDTIGTVPNVRPDIAKIMDHMDQMEIYDGGWKPVLDEVIRFRDQPHVRTTQTANYASIAFPGSASVYLGPATEIELTSNTDYQSEILLVSGYVLVQIPVDFPAGGRFVVSTPNGATAEVSGSLMGLWYDPTASSLYADCLEGNCRFNQSGNEKGIPAGDHILIGTSMQTGGGTRNELWQFVPAMVAAPTLTPTFTLTPTETPLPPTVTPTNTAVWVPTAEPPTPIAVSLAGPSSNASFGGNTLNITISNPNVQTLTNVNFTASYPAGLTNTSAAVTDCSGGAGGGAGDGYVSLSGATLGGASSCSVQVSVTGPAGTYTVTFRAYAAGAEAGNWASATLDIP